MLSDRRQKVLAALIEEYVARALPVGSCTLTKHYKLGVSPATVRNELSVLEDGGYITQPHTSAGRIPTDFGYRAFVDNLLLNGLIANDERYKTIVSQLRNSANELDELLERTSSALARLTNCLSIVIAPSALDVHIKQLSLISLTPRRALVVLVTEEGQVFNRQIEFGEDVSSDALAQVQNFLGNIFCGKSFQEMESASEQTMVEAFRDPLVRMVVDEVFFCLQEGEISRFHRLGISSLLTQPEFRQSQALLPIMKVLENDTVLLQILDEASGKSEGIPKVTIGSENTTEEFAGVSMVASRYGRGESAGVVAVIGPTRMDYSKVIRAVSVARAALEDV